ncbi:unnamed protein product [Diamesa serratosioi]
MWPANAPSPPLEMTNTVGNLLDSSNYYKASPFRWSSQTPFMQQEISTAYAPSFDTVYNNNMFQEKNNQMSWNSEEISQDISKLCSTSTLSYLFQDMTPPSYSGGFEDSLSLPLNVQKTSKFPEKRFSEFISSDLSLNSFDEDLRDTFLGINPWRCFNDATYTKDDFDFDFGSQVEIQQQTKMETEPQFKPSRSSTPVDSPEMAFESDNQFQHTSQYHQNTGYYFSNPQDEVVQQENGPWGSPAADRPIQQYSNTPYNRQTVSQENKYRDMKTSKKTKPIVDVEAVYKSHTVRDSKGRCLCPILRKYECPICKKDGDEAHTTKYCKERKILTEEDMRKPLQPMRRYR